jgi:hypothetical protein
VTVAASTARIAAGLALAAGLAVAWLAWRNPADHAPNAGTVDNVTTVQLAVEAYRHDHGGHAPPARSWVAALVPYLPGGHLPTNPFDPRGAPQQAALTPEGCAGLAGAKAPTPAGTGLGPCFAPGALVYDADPGGGAYVIYGIGLRQGQAVVAAREGR